MLVAENEVILHQDMTNQAIDSQDTECVLALSYNSTVVPSNTPILRINIHFQSVISMALSSKMGNPQTEDSVFKRLVCT